MRVIYLNCFSLAAQPAHVKQVFGLWLIPARYLFTSIWQTLRLADWFQPMPYSGGWLILLLYMRCGYAIIAIVWAFPYHLPNGYCFMYMYLLSNCTSFQIFIASTLDHHFPAMCSHLNFMNLCDVWVKYLIAIRVFQLILHILLKCLVTNGYIALFYSCMLCDYMQ